MQRHRQNVGFTLVELLIVIVVIAILAAVTIVAYNGVTKKAKVSALTAGLQQVDQSLRMWAIDNGYSTWPTDPVHDGGTSLNTMIQNDPSLKRYLNAVPAVAGVQTEDWQYDNEGDTRSNCSDPHNGVNIIVRYMDDSSIAQGVDNALDDGDLNCGRIEFSDHNILFFSIDYDQIIGN